MQSNPPNKKTVLLAIVVAEVSFIGSQREKRQLKKVGKTLAWGGGDVEMNVGNDLRFNLSEALLLG